MTTTGAELVPLDSGSSIPALVASAVGVPTRSPKRRGASCALEGAADRILFAMLR